MLLIFRKRRPGAKEPPQAETAELQKVSKIFKQSFDFIKQLFEICMLQNDRTQKYTHPADRRKTLC